MRIHNYFIFFTLLSFVFAPFMGHSQCMPDVEPPLFSPNHPLMQTINNGDEIAYQCGEQEAFFEEYLTVTDNCDPEPMVSFSKGVTVGDCTTDGFMVTVDYCWKADDNQGNQSEFCFTAIILDEEKPEFDLLPADITIDLSIGEELPPVDILTALDACHGFINVTIDLDLTYPADSCGYTLFRIWSAIDPCGNEVTHTQTITAIDNCVVCPSELTENIDISAADCQSENGQITLDMVGQEDDYSYALMPLAGLQTGFGNIFENLPSGDYQITVTHDTIPDCQTMIEVNIPQLLCTDIVDVDIIEEQEYCIPNAVFDHNGNITSASICGDGNVNTVLASAINGTCLTLTPNPGFSGQSPDEICVVHCFDNSSSICDTTIIQVNVVPCQIQVDNIAITPATCDDGDGSALISASGQNGTLGYEWSPNISTSNSADNLNSFEEYSVTMTDDLGCSATIENLTIGLDCPTMTDSLSLTFECGDDVLSLCLNSSELPGTPNITSVCQLPANGSLTALNDTCFNYQPIANFSGLDQVCLSICDDQGICDTVLFEITVEQCPQQFPCVDIPQDTLFAQASDCGDEIKFCVEFPLGEILNYDFEVNGLPYSNNIGTCAFDTLLSYGFSAIPGNGMNGPYEIVSWFIDGNDVGGGSFDDVFELTDLMNMLDPSGNWALDTITFNISSFNTQSSYGQLTITQQVSGDLVMLNINSATAPTGSALYFPVGSHEVVMTHQDFGFCVDTFTAIIHCAETQTVFDEINVEQNGTFCPESSLPGGEENIEIICPSCEFTSFEINGQCIDYQGIEVGTDEILILVCDEFGFCDSTWLIVNVVDNGLPVAFVDYTSTLESTEVEVDVLENDFINGNLTSLRLLIDPIHGIAVINADQTITFTPDRGFCGQDAFAYEICNEVGCDTSAVDIEVKCTRPVVFNGFSPNEDGMNDLFKIDNLEFYPDHELIIFNRWGTQVYSRRNYSSDWDGRDVNSKMLPDGSYFYLLDLGNGDTMKGYVQIHR